jgi:hypothetical protein
MYCGPSSVVELLNSFQLGSDDLSGLHRRGLPKLHYRNAEHHGLPNQYDSIFQLDQVAATSEPAFALGHKYEGLLICRAREVDLPILVQLLLHVEGE